MIVPDLSLKSRGRVQQVQYIHYIFFSFCQSISFLGCIFLLSSGTVSLSGARGLQSVIYYSLSWWSWSQDMAYTAGLAMTVYQPRKYTNCHITQINIKNFQHNVVTFKEKPKKVGCLLASLFTGWKDGRKEGRWIDRVFGAQAEKRG